MLAGKILLTGSGFLTRGILRRARTDNWQNEIVVYSRSPASQDICRRKYPDAHYVVGDIRDTERLKLAMLGAKIVIHTAAFKYVPEAETNVAECVSVNIDGTFSVMDAARQNLVSNVVIISTDKAVRPVNVYGMTKAVAERLMTEMSARDTSGVKYAGVRYGNVIGSTGSIVPVLKAQAAQDGFVTLTNPEMTRFWLQIDEAIDLITDALDPHTAQGSILIPTPQSLTLEELARAVCPDVPAHIVGSRPGEKMHEDLLTEYESVWVKPSYAYYQLLALHLRNSLTESKTTFTLSSDVASPMPIDNFLSAVEDAQYV